jgi:hypothetical protein
MFFYNLFIYLHFTNDSTCENNDRDKRTALYYCHSTTKQQKGSTTPAPTRMDKAREGDDGRGSRHNTSRAQVCFFLFTPPPHIDNKWGPRCVSGPFYLFSLVYLVATSLKPQPTTPATTTTTIPLP